MKVIFLTPSAGSGRAVRSTTAGGTVTSPFAPAAGTRRAPTAPAGGTR